MYLHREPQLRLQSRVRLLARKQLVFRMHSLYHDQEERLISVQTDMQTDMDMDTDMDINIAVKSVSIGALGSREASQSTSLLSIQSNTKCSK